jgi:hypothetical protein
MSHEKASDSQRVTRSFLPRRLRIITHCKYHTNKTVCVAKNAWQKPDLRQ